MAAIWLLLVISAAFASAENCTTGFSVVAPEVAVPGKTTAILVTLHGIKKNDTIPLNVTVRLEAQNLEEGNKILASASQMVTGYGIIQLNIPSSPAVHCMLHTTVDCKEDVDCNSQSHTSIRLLGPVRDVIVRPSRLTYKPGETITFWLMALDHDLRLVQDQLASVSLSDPAGTKVAIWEQLSMEEGIKKLSTKLADGAQIGKWIIEAQCASFTTRVALSVTNSLSNVVTASPAGEQHSVELRFADSMRRRYKPGLPFVGRVEAVSTEKRVRVRVKLYDEKTDIYSQDIDISTGEGSFVVPTVLAYAPYINLQAELVAVEGKEIETHYVLAQEKLKRWSSTSKCYLLIENLPRPLQAGSEASAVVWSSCSCREKLLAAVTNGGRAVHWTILAAAVQNDTALCRFNFTFLVTADMAPVSSLLVYFVTDSGEPVSDVAEFHVKLVHKEVVIAVEDRRWWYPRAALQLRVLAPGDSTICLIGARTPTETRFDNSPPQDHELSPEFVSAGVSLFVGEGSCTNSGGGGVLYRQRTSPAPPTSGHLVPPAQHDRLWMWKCFNYTNQLSIEGVTISAPTEAGRWSLWALSLSNQGLRFSSPKTINVFRPIQIEYKVPEVMKIGETVEIDVKIYNNINSCMDVIILLALSSGASFSHTGESYQDDRLRLGSRSSTQLVVFVTVNSVGTKNITVEITGYSADNCSYNRLLSNESLVGSLIRSASVTVLPEGQRKLDTQSAYFCANEHLAVSSRGSWEWQWVAAPRNRAGLVLELKSQGSAHIALSSINEPSENMYRVVFEKSRVWIARGKYGYDVHLASAEQTSTDLECSSSSWCPCWVWWEGGRLSVGRGAVPFERRLLSWPLAHDMKVKYVGFSSLWGERADFRIWNFNEEAGFSQVLDLGLPHGVVPGSASGTLLISGGLHLPLSDVQINPEVDSVWKNSKLSSTAASFAPLLALEHIPHLIDDNEKEIILKNLPEQIQILLSFRRKDNSFGDHPSMSSHVSTVQALEILSKIQSYNPVDPEIVQSVKTWIQSKQNKDGSFSPLSADIDFDYVTPKDKLSKEYYDVTSNGVVKEFDRKMEVTSETLTTLLEVGVESQKDQEITLRAQTYIESNMKNITSPAVLAAAVLALVHSRSSHLTEALKALKNASTTEEGEFGWPPPKKDAGDWLADGSDNIKSTNYEAVTIEQYLAGVRVLLSACARGALAEGEAVARFLYYRASTLRTHPSLAYVATKAAAQFAALAHDRHRSLTISLATAGMELTDTLELLSNTPSRSLQLPGLPTKVFVYATGAGCATVQGATSYSTYVAKPENDLLRIDSAIIEEISTEISSIERLQETLPTLNIKTCFKWKNTKPSGILRLEVTLFSGYELYSVNPVLLSGSKIADLHYGSRRENAWFTFANITSSCPVCLTYQIKSDFIIKGLRPAFAKLYPLNRPDLSVETFFHAPSSSPLRNGVTDDDMLAWFDKTGPNNLSSNIEHICECGRVCTDATSNKIEKNTTAKPNIVSTFPKTTKLPEEFTVETTETTKELNVTDNIKPIIIPTASLANDLVITNPNETLVPDKSKSNELIIQIVPTSKTKDAKKNILPRRKGTLKSTYGDNDIENVTVTHSTDIFNKGIKDNRTVKNETKHETQIENNTPKITIIKNDISKTEVNLIILKPLKDSIYQNNTINPKTSKINMTTPRLQNILLAPKQGIHPIKIIKVTKKNLKNLHKYKSIDKPDITIQKKSEFLKHNKNSSATYEKEYPKIKSINKEIQKIPDTPYSETTKVIEKSELSNNQANRSDFEVLEKTNANHRHVVELLKEDTDLDNIKISDVKTNAVTNNFTTSDETKRKSL